MLLYKISDEGVYINLEDISSVELVENSDEFIVYMKSMRIYNQTADQVSYVISTSEFEEMLDFLDSYESN